MDEEWIPRCPDPTGLVTPLRLAREGGPGPTPGAAAGPRWRRTSHGLHVPTETQPSPEQRIAEAAARLRTPGMVTGWAALRLAGGSFFDGLARGGAEERDVPVWLPHTSRIRAGGVRVIRTRRELPPPEVRHGIVCARAEIALVHELLLTRGRYAAATAVDMALAAGIVDLSNVRALLPDWPVPLPQRVAWAVERACADCRSPRESEMLVTWEDSGFGRPLMNVEVLDLAGRVLAVVDLLCVASGTAGEYNGAVHANRSRRRRDAARECALREVGLETFTIVAGDSVETQVHRMRAARERALWLPEAERRWRVGRVVRAETSGPHEPTDDDLAAHGLMMREHYARLTAVPEP